MAVCQNLVPLVNIKIAGKWMFIPLKMVFIGIDPYPYGYPHFPHGILLYPLTALDWRYDTADMVLDMALLKTWATRRGHDISRTMGEINRKIYQHNIRYQDYNGYYMVNDGS